MTAISPLLWGLLLFQPLLIAIGQILFKMSSTRLAESGGPIYKLFFDPVFIAAMALYGIATLLWVYVLKAVPLAYAYSFMALAFVMVPLLAACFLQETLTLRYAAGASCIILGLVIVQT